MQITCKEGLLFVLLGLAQVGHQGHDAVTILLFEFLLADVIQVEGFILRHQLHVLHILGTTTYQLLLDVGGKMAGERVTHIDTLASHEMVRPVRQRVYEIESVRLCHLAGVIDQHFE